MKTINYDFSNLEKSMSDLKRNPTSNVLNELKKEINRFYKDCTCSEVLYTNNTDKMFFGMCVIPYLENDAVTKVITGTDKVKKRITNYYLEIDSKLINLGLSNREMVAILLHEIGHVVNTVEPLEKVQDAVHIYINKNDDLNVDKFHRNVTLFRYAIIDSINSMTSLFRKTDEEIIADEFSVYCGFGRELETAYKKIVKNFGTLNNTVPNKLLTLQWSFRIYKELGLKRIHAVKTLNKAISLSGSQLQNRHMGTVKDSLNKVGNEYVVQESLDIFKKANEFHKKIKYKGIRGLEEELYEFNLRAKNVDEHDDALAIIRQINTRLAIIEDYITNERLTDKELDRWSDVLNKYRMVREEVSKKTTYDEKYYGLFVQMPNIKSRYQM